MSKLNPKTVHREFSGVPGALAIATFLPLIIVLFYYLCNEQYSVRGITVELGKVKSQLPSNVHELLQLCFDKNCWLAYTAWFSILAVLDIYAPGKDIPGVELRDGTRLMYRINGKSMSGLLIALLLARLFSLESYFMPELQFLYDNQLKLTLTTIVASFAMSFFVYAISFIPLTTPNGLKTRERILAVPGNTGNPIYDCSLAAS